MSHDRKPGRARVMKTGDEPPRRRRHDTLPVIVDAASVARARKSAGRGWMMLTVLFLLAAIGCATITELYVPA